MKKRYSGFLTTVLACFLFCFSGLSFEANAQKKKSKTKDGTTATSDKGSIEAALNEAYTKYKDLKEGKNADYIPELAKVPSEQFAIVIVTTDGQVFSKGDIDALFSIQSISKVITLARNIEDHGAQAIQDKIGVDPTGEKFNSAVIVENKKGKEINPLVNAGAIASTSMIKGKDYNEKWNTIMQVHNDFAGRQLAVNDPVYKSEAATNQHNQALASLMNSFERMYFDPPQSVDIYTKQCAINVNTKDLAQMAATFANGGTNPVTKKKVVSPQTVAHTLPVMATCGLYDDSGIWFYNVGLPAKSGVGGGIIAVVPGQYGIAAFSPRLDEAGNSVRAQKAITDIVNKLNLNPYLVQPK
ncbi:glutaminase A [Adhaeribacter sp. BT258]|uniref:Glutaminase n=1 Tax=Adhaeribacter terrigena TaxID=2793070 RepID=A0ABS1C7L0_9BACT|nr:glutaminase A [Adhaeribacter terrigena]MBK0404688.1 glutaminase A [Adhaeribacter terrigena]